MNELHEILNRALGEPIELAFPDARTARSWVHRAHNYIRRHWPEGKQLMISQRKTSVRMGVPQMTVRSLHLHPSTSPPKQGSNS